MTCKQYQCPDCEIPLIHQLHRKWDEASSGLSHLMRFDGPLQLTVGDVDLYSLKLVFPDDGRNEALLCILDHKEPNEAVGIQQMLTYRFFETMFALVRDCHPFGVDVGGKSYSLHPSSGVYILRGPIGMLNGKIAWLGPHEIKNLDGEVVKRLERFADLSTWLNAGLPWEPRNGRARYG